MRALLLLALVHLAFIPHTQAAPPAAKEGTMPAPEEGIVMFTPPLGWNMVDNAPLPGTVKVMVIGKGAHTFPPSMNLSTEPYKGTLKQYLNIVKAMNDAQGYDWKDLGTLRTEAGPASLSQVDTKTEWGDVRLMHVILLKNGRVYILTASALKEEFSKFYKDFFTSLRSLRVNKDLFEMVSTPQRRTQLKAAYQNVQEQWKKLLAQKQKEQSDVAPEQLKKQMFTSAEFQDAVWKPFKDTLNQKYSDLGSEWQTLMLQKTEDDLFK